MLARREESKDLPEPTFRNQVDPVLASTHLERSALRIRAKEIPPAAAVFVASFAVSLLFLLFGPYSNFAPAGFLDPWIYTGYFTHFSYQMHLAGVSYYVSRLPWIIPGLLVFKIATPAAASVLLNALIMASSITAVYFIVFWHYGTTPAILGCIALMTNPYFMSGLAWDYPDGPAVAYALLALACFLRPAPKFLPSGVAGGACLALSGYTNLAGLPVLLGILMIPLWRYRKSLKRLVGEAGHIVLGGSAVTIVLAVVGKLLLGTFLFFMPQISMILYTRAHPEYLRNMWGDGYAWIPDAYRLFPPLFILFLGGLLLVKRWNRGDTFIGSYLCLVAASVLFCIFEFKFHNVGLRVAYCSTYLMAPLGVFTGLLMGELLPRASHPAGARTVAPISSVKPAAPIAAGLVGLALPFLYRYGTHPVFSRRELWGGMLVVGLLAAGCVLWMQVRKRGRQSFAYAVAGCLILAGLFVGPAYDQGLGYVWSDANWSTFQTMMQIEGFVDSVISPERRVRFWYDMDEAPPSAEPGLPKLSYFFDSTYSLYLWGWVDFSKQLASKPVEEIKQFVSADTTFVHLTTDPAKITERTRMLTARGIVLGNERRQIVSSRYGNLVLVLQDVLDNSGFH